jgi:16S rRNA (adenine1518-N6/adenine1519-N6)-dimethyltransferase
VSGLDVDVIEGDAMKLDWAAIAPPTQKATVVANLPYNVATPLVADLLDRVPGVARLVVMVQREVALRLAAAPGSPDYGAVSVKVAYWGRARLLGDVPPTVFVSRPKVTSSIVEISRRDQPAVDVDPMLLFSLVRTAFGQRRKMLRRSLADAVSPEMFTTAGVDPSARPETLSVHDWGRLATAVGG